MGETARLATGNINSLYGALDDPRLFQINNAIQPGNSGGPLFNKGGELVGICVAGLSARYFYENQGIIPQNMNFAIKASYLKNLVGLLPDGDSILKRPNVVNGTSLEQTIEQLSPYVVQIRVY
jgi:serine protease Do